ncbi:MAG: holin [Ruminococcaceae bacterium]|nr:holin [Oscillospiraceae bacterium]
MVDLTQVIVAVLTLVISLITAFLIPYLKTKVSGEQLETIKFWVNIAVEAAEMIYVGTGRGQEKKEYVVQFLNSKGFTLNVAEIENLIEAAVMELKLEQKKEA